MRIAERDIFTLLVLAVDAAAVLPCSSILCRCYCCYSGVMRCSAQPSTGIIAVQWCSAGKKRSHQKSKGPRTDRKEGEFWNKVIKNTQSISTIDKGFRPKEEDYDKERIRVIKCNME